MSLSEVIDKEHDSWKNDRLLWCVGTCVSWWWLHGSDEIRGSWLTPYSWSMSSGLSKKSGYPVITIMCLSWNRRRRKWWHRRWKTTRLVQQNLISTFVVTKNSYMHAWIWTHSYIHQLIKPTRCNRITAKLFIFWMAPKRIITLDCKSIRRDILQRRSEISTTEKSGLGNLHFSKSSPWCVTLLSLPKEKYYKEIKSFSNTNRIWHEVMFGILSFSTFALAASLVVSSIQSNSCRRRSRECFMSSTSSCTWGESTSKSNKATETSFRML